jgi:hypothetical protein
MPRIPDLSLIVVLGLAALSLAGCTTLHELPTAAPAQTTAALEPGARLVITLHDRQVIEERFIEATAEALVVGHVERAGRGLDRENRAEDKRFGRITVAWERIARVEQRQASGWRTVALVVIPIAALTSMATQMAVMP